MAELDGVFYKEIVEQALREFPNEACGLIAAEAGVPVRVYSMTNVDASPATYRLDGKEQLTVFDELDERGWELWAIYHSHTHSEAYPSETDRKLAFYPDSRYVLLSVADQGKNMEVHVTRDMVRPVDVSVRWRLETLDDRS